MKISLKNIIKKNEGYTGADLSVSLIVILISIGVIASMYYNIYFAGSGLKRNVTATNYAINVLEAVQSTEYEKVTFNLEEDATLKNTIYNLPIFRGQVKENASEITENKYSFKMENYDITVEIEKYSDRFDAENPKEDYIKIIKVTVAYNLGKDKSGNANKEILQISTVKTIK